MRNKRGYDELYILVAIIIGILILFLSIYFLFHEYFSSKEIDTEVCRESILLRSNLPEATLSGFSLATFKDKYPLRCKTKVIHINQKNIDKAGEIISREMASCWALFSSGDVNPFPSTLFKGHTYCFPCARIHFDEDISTQLFSESQESLYEQIGLINTYLTLQEKLQNLDESQKNYSTTKESLQKLISSTGEKLKKELRISNLDTNYLESLKSKLYDSFYKESLKQDKKIKENFNIPHALKTHKINGVSYWDYLKNSGKYYEPFNPAFANPFKFKDYFEVEFPDLNFWQRQGLQGLGQKLSTKISSEKDDSIGFTNVSLPTNIYQPMLDSNQKDLVIVYGTYVHEEPFSFGLNYIPYLFYYVPREENINGKSFDPVSLNIRYTPFVIPSATTWNIIKTFGPEAAILIPIPGPRIVSGIALLIKGAIAYHEVKDEVDVISRAKKQYPSICDYWVGIPA